MTHSPHNLDDIVGYQVRVVDYETGEPRSTILEQRFTSTEYAAACAYADIATDIERRRYALVDNIYSDGCTSPLD